MSWATIGSKSCFRLTVYSFFTFDCKESNQSDFVIYQLVMSMCRIVSCVVGKGCLLWPMWSLDKTRLVFALLYFILQSQTCLLLQVSFYLLLCIPIPYDEKCAFFFLVLILESLIGLQGTIQLQLLRHQWLEHRLGLLWYLMVCLGNEPRSFCHFWFCTQVMHFGLFIDYEGYSISSKGFLPIVVEVMVLCSKFILSHPF